ncbi:splicing factor 3B subunit 4-like isoform X2 [Spea bombifrons]|uniref:splicing factor 3B subunit 4-like isoform X2 n=1 Tax=Spea bombifrons TaxID=233779 RepID=UPI00234B2B73|nr:splicing factor 3B subunit 4-like isoform X2 [Spea bombifrons]
MPMDRLEAGPEVRKFRGRGNRGRGSYISRGDRGMKGQMSIGREKFRDKSMNGVVPLRRGMGRMHPYQDPRGRGGARGQHPGYLPPHPEIEMSEPFPPPPPLPRFSMRIRGHPPPLPPGRMGFRGMPPPPRGRGILPPPPPQRGPFPHPRRVT